MTQKNIEFPRSRRAFTKAVGTGVIASTAGCLGSVTGSEYPSESITFTVPYGAGGGFDRYSRIIAKHLEDRFDVEVPVRNEPGAGGVVGLESVSQSDPDGYTISTFAAEFISFFQQIRDVNFDVTEMTYYGQYASTQYVLVVPADSDIETVDDFVARVEDRDIDVGVDIPQGDGLYLGIWGEITGLYPGVNVMENLLPYEGTSSIVPAMEQGEVDATIRSVASMRQWVEDGTLRPLLVGTTGDPPSAFSNAETFGTLGVNNADAASQVTFQTRPIVGPPDVPDEHVETLGDAILDVVESDGYERDVADAELTYGEFADGEGAKEAVRNKADQWSEYLDEAEKLLGALD